MHNVAGKSLAVVLALALVVVSVGGCTASTSSGSMRGSTSDKAVTPDVAESPADAAKRLAGALHGATTLNEARPIVREILARCGALVQTKTGELRAQPVEPTLGIWYLDFQVDNLALDHLEGQGFTLEQLAQCMSEYPADGAELWKDPLVLREFMKQMWIAANNNPNDPLAFGPLVLAEIARQRDPAVAIGDDTADPATYPMSNLEVLVFSLSVSRGIPTGAPTGSAPADEVVLGEPATTVCVPPTSWWNRAWALIDTPAYAEGSNPCSWLESKWGKDVKDMAGAGAGAGIDEALSTAAEKVTEAGSETAKKAGKAAAMAVGWLTALISLVATMGGYSLTVTPEPSKVHYFGTSPDHGDATAKYVATVSSRPVADKDLQACLDWAGVELPDEKSAADAIVRWIPGHGIGPSKPEHAIPSAGKNVFEIGAGAGRYEDKVGEDGRSEFYLDVSAEKKSGLEKKGKLKKDQIVMTVELFVQNPSGGKIMGAMLLGGAPDMAKAWADKWFPKRAVSVLPVEWHEAQRWRGVLEGGNGLRLVFTSGEGLESVWDVHFEGALDVGNTIPITGKSAVDLQRSDAQFTIVGTGTAVDDGTTFNVTATYTFPHVAIGGTAEDPTLDLSGIDMKVKVTADNGGGSTSGGGKGKVGIILEPYSE